MEDSKNIVIYDWLSFTSKTHSVDDIITALGLDGCPFEETKGAHGYRDRKYFSSISIHFNGRPDMGVWCEMSGQGCRAFETLSSVGWDRLFDWINRSDFKITRLDVAFDDHTGVLDIDRICNDTCKGNFVCRSDFWEVVRSSKGSAVYHGSPQSLIRFRIYDKARERNCEPGTHWIRVEMQLRNERAIAFTKLFDNPLITIGDAFSGVLLNYLRYVEQDETDSNKWRWSLTDYWFELVANISPIKIYTAPGMEYNIDNLDSFVFGQAGNAIAAELELISVDEFLDRIKHRTSKPNPKYKNLVNQYKGYSNETEI